MDHESELRVVAGWPDSGIVNEQGCEMRLEVALEAV